MNKIIATVAFFCSLVWISCITGDPGSDPNNKALADTARFTSLQWTDSVVNFGSIRMGEKINVVFHFRNTGKYPLFLTNVKAGCGCTVPDYTKGAIAPGGEGMVSGAFDSNKAHPGEVRKSIFVTANTRGKISHTLIFTGTIEEKAK